MLTMHSSSTNLLKILIMLKCVYLTLGNSDYSMPAPQDYSSYDLPAPKPGWVDPFDMLGESYSSDSLIVQSDVEIHSLKERCGNYGMYLRRFVNLFLKAIESRDSSVSKNSMNRVKLEFFINGKEINILQEFGKGKSQRIEVVSDVFDSIFSQKTPQDSNIFSFNGMQRWLQNVILKIISSPEWTVVSSVSLMLFLTLWFINKTHSYRLALFTVLLTVFFAGFGFTWIRMYEEKEVERYVDSVIHGNVPKHCSGQPMAWYEHMYYRMFGVDCYQFFKGRDVRPMVKVSPTDVLAETFSSMIINPATNVGKAYGNFIHSCMGHLPIWLKPLALPLSFIIPILFVVILLAFLFNYRMSLSLTGFHLIPSWDRSSRTSNEYIEDISRRKNESLQQNSGLQSLISDSKTPVFVMNWLGLKKLSTGNLLSDKKNNKEATEKEVEVEEDDRECAESMAEFNKFEEFISSIESQKAIEDGRKRRSIYTCTEGSGSLASRNNDENLPMIKHAGSSGDRNRTPESTGNIKEHKEKTT